MANVKRSDWLKKLTSKNDDVDEEYDGEDEDDENSVQDVLTVLNIDLQTQIPEDVKTSGQMGNVQFRVSKPKGYLFDDVDVALDAAISSLRTYEKLIHKRDLDVHRLATEIDKKNTDYANLKFQAEAYRAQGKVVTGDDGKPIVVTGEVEVKDYNSLQEQYERLLLNQQELEGWISNAQPYISQLEAKVAEIDESANRTQAIPLPGATALEPDNSKEDIIASLEQQVADLQEQLHQAQTSPQESSPAESNTGSPEQNLSSEEKEQFIALQGWAEQVQVKYAEMESYVAELEESAQSAQQQAQELQSSLELAQAELANAQDQLETAQNQAVDVSSYENQVQGAQERITVLEAEIEERDNYIESLAAWAAEVEKQAQEQESAVVTEGNYQDTETTVAYEEEPVAPQQSTHRQPAPQPAPEPAPQPAPEDEEDAFSRALRDINDPEVEDDVRRRPARSTGNYKRAAPGSPLTSLPPGADINDYL